MLEIRETAAIYIIAMPKLKKTREVEKNRPPALLPIVPLGANKEGELRRDDILRLILIDAIATALKQK